ncbi:MAG: hypothetical protein QGH45_10565, partial [Myxococcota bacterium]|nr:hypothetical protein [Myxococcota bacterium]
MWTFWGDPLDEELARGDLVLATADDPLQTPGARTTDGKCKQVRLPGKGVERWEASWSAGATEPVVREDPSNAIEAARRRACMTANDGARAEYFQAVAYMAAEEKVAAWRAGSGAAVADLFACVTGGEPELQPAEGGREKPDQHPAYQCQAATFSGTAVVAGVGWATDLERAGEEALTELVHSRRRAELGGGLLAAARAAAETRQTMLAIHYSSVSPSLAASDLADRGRLSCVGLDAAEPPPLGWSPGSLYAMESCGERVFEPPISELTSVGELGDARDKLCRDRAYYGVTLANEALANVSPELWRTMASSGWGTALSCEADCLGHTTLAIDGEAVRLPGLPDRSTREAS